MKRLLIAGLVLVAAGAAYLLWDRAPAPEAAARPRGGDEAVRVETVTVQPTTLSRVIEALGTARANESVTLTANVTETVRRVNFEDGQFVKQGDVLIELTRAEESSQLREAEIAVQDARRALARVEDLGARSLVPTSEVDDAQAALAAARARLQTVRARLGDRLITAPFDGVLGFRDVSVGTLVSPGTPITTLDDISRVKVDFTVPEAALGLIAVGDALRARTVSERDRVFTGTVQTIGTRIDSVTRAAQVRAILPNEDGRLRPGMLLTVDVTVDEHEGIEVPARAVVQESTRAYLFVVGPEQTAERREVTLGIRREGFVEITAGLAPGEDVVVSGVVKLRDGSRVTRTGAAKDAVQVARPAE